MSNSEKNTYRCVCHNRPTKGSVDRRNGIMTVHSYLPYLPQQASSFLSPSGPRTSCGLRPSNLKLQ